MEYITSFTNYTLRAAKAIKSCFIVESDQPERIPLLERRGSPTYSSNESWSQSSEYKEIKWKESEAEDQSEELSEGSINYDSDLEDEDFGINEEEILTYDNTNPNYKMQTALNVLEQYDFESLKNYIEDNHKNININNRSTLNSLTDALLQELYTTASERQIVATMGDVRRIISAETNTINQKAKRFGQLRKVLKGRFGEDSKIVKKHKRFGISHEDHNLKQQVAKSNRKERLQDRVQITDKEVRELIHRHSASDDVFDLIIALQLATGSRFIEATRLSAFKPSSREGFVKIVGIAKKPKDEITEVERPILGLDLDEVLEIVKKIRKELKKKYPQFETLDNDDLTKLLVNRVNTRIKKMGVEGVDTSHMLRKLYANMSYKELSKDERKKIDSHQWIQNVLGHASIDTSASYANVKISKVKATLQNQEDIERKFDMVDAKDEKQDRQIENLENKVSVERGGAIDRAKKIMDELHSKKIHITEKLLKTEYHIGSKTISALKDYKKALNDSLKN